MFPEQACYVENISLGRNANCQSQTLRVPSRQKSLVPWLQHTESRMFSPCFRLRCDKALSASFSFLLITLVRFNLYLYLRPSYPLATSYRIPCGIHLTQFVPPYSSPNPKISTVCTAILLMPSTHIPVRIKSNQSQTGAVSDTSRTPGNHHFEYA